MFSYLNFTVKRTYGINLAIFIIERNMIIIFGFSRIADRYKLEFILHFGGMNSTIAVNDVLFNNAKFSNEA